MSEILSLPTDIEWGKNQQTVDFVTLQYNEIKKHEQGIVQRAILIGGAFKAVKEQFKRRHDFFDWVENNFKSIGLKKSSAYIYLNMGIYAESVKDAKSLREAIEIIKVIRNPGESGKSEESKEQKDAYPEIAAFTKALEKRGSTKEKRELVFKMSETCLELEDKIFNEEPKPSAELKESYESMLQTVMAMYKEEISEERREELKAVEKELRESLAS